VLFCMEAFSHICPATSKFPSKRSESKQKIIQGWGACDIWYSSSAMIKNNFLCPSKEPARRERAQCLVEAGRQGSELAGATTTLGRYVGMGGGGKWNSPPPPQSSLLATLASNATLNQGPCVGATHELSTFYQMINRF